MKKYPFQILLLFVFSIGFSQTIDIQSFATGFNMPVSIKNADDDRLFVVEKSGYIRIVNADGSVNTTPFLDIDNLVVNVAGIGDERGLLGLTFHPNYTSNSFFYVNYINNSGDTVVSRFSVEATNPDLADANSELIILTITQPFANHNAGDMAFGPDGFLYIASGDGGSGGDPNNYGQNLNTLLGKMLRIDVDNPSGGNNYGIPADNPFFNDGDANTLDEIWAYGLRNPWRFSFDQQTGDIWIADVGQGNYEEINIASSAEAGLNYGWRCYEGNNVFNDGGCPDPNTLTFPVGEYPHIGMGNFKCSITGGYRYRGSAYPNFNGLYFFADFCSDEIGTLTENGGTWDMTFSDVFGGNGWSAFGEDMNGEIYIAGISSGTIYRIIDTDNPAPTEWYQDADNDTYGNPNVSQTAANQPNGYVADNTDCDDTNTNINPGATEVVDNGVDEDCDGFDLQTWYEDADNDTYGNPTISQTSNTQPNGYALDNTDCDDTNANINPGTTEVADNGIDEDCDGFDLQTWYEDADNDTFGNPNIAQTSNTQPNGYVLDNTDCDDTNANINPNVIEIPNNNLDDNCDGIDEITDSDFSFDMYPNPARSRVYFLFNENEIPMSIAFYDILGKHLFTRTTFQSNEIEISTSNLSRGLYLVSVFKANSTLTHKKLLIE